MLSRPKFAIASLSLGCNDYHDLPTKIRIASELGYEGIEIFMPDFEKFVEEVAEGHHMSLFSSTTLSSDKTIFERQCAAAISRLCKSLAIGIPILQPLRDFENFVSEEALMEAVDEAERWFELARYLDTDLILVCSNYLEGPCPVSKVPGSTMRAYLNAQVRAFRILGERAQRHGIRIGYEPLAWGTVVNRWEQVWTVVKEVDMPNVGVILDSFNSLGQQYADPSLPSGVRPLPFSTHESNFVTLSQTIPADKLFFFQLGDASRPLKPFVSLPSKPARMQWSRSSRLFPFEQELGGFMPVSLFTEAVMKTGYQGWWSLEVFNTSLADKDKESPRKHGVRGLKGLNRLWDEVRASVPLQRSTASGHMQPSNSGSRMLRFVHVLLSYLHVDWIFQLPIYIRRALFTKRAE